MEALVMNVETLPMPIREKIHAPKVAVQEREGGIFLLPVKEESGLRGIATNSNLSVEKFREYKNEDIEEVRQLLHKEIAEKGTSATIAVSNDGWEAYIEEHYAKS